MFQKIIFIFIAFVAVCTAKAQKKIAPDRDTLQAGTLLNIIYAERMNFKKEDSLNQFVSLAGNVQIKQGKTFFYADSAVLNQYLNILEAFGKVHINDADSIHTYANYLKYIGKEKKAYLKGNVKLTDGKGILTTDELEYDVTTKIGTYLKGGKVVNGKTVLTSKQANYYGETKDVYFINKVVLKDPDYTIITDTLLYNTYTNITTFVTATTILSGKTKIKTRKGYYDLNKKKAYFGERPEIEDSTGTLKADEVAIDDSTGKSEFKGNVVYKGKDSTSGFDIIANKVERDSKKGSIRATQAPILLIKQGKDSVLIRADTLFSAKLSDLLLERNVHDLRDSSEGKLYKIPSTDKDTTSDKYFEAYSNVKIFSDSMQAIGDSLFYSLKDSIFRLYKNPIAWSNVNQITGDTIYLYTQNKKPEKIRVFENALAISHAGSNYYNQVSGRTINGYFVDGKLDSLRCKGSPASSVYYGVDDYGKFFGVNVATCDVIDLFFKNGEPNKVVFKNNLDGITYPMQQVNHDLIKVKGFKWLQHKRPKTKYEILSY
ncbi:MAG TPA: OstA-like protein [Chitinophagaceae bacterium]|nr:OstA-like protein [Chitinophagaceae bacterium]HNM34130.1 OstA-like protein [Chitinophagaceae bacterium]